MKKIIKILVLISAILPVDCAAKSLLRTGISKDAQASYTKSGSARAIIKDIDHHQGGMGERISFRFIGEPLCHYIPNSEVDLEQALAGNKEVALQFLLPAVEVKGEKNKQLINQINATTYETHSLRIEQIKKPIPGYVLTVRFHPKHRGFQLESSVSLKGEPTLWVTFYQLDTLQKINYSANSIRKTALATTAQALEKKKYV